MDKYPKATYVRRAVRSHVRCNVGGELWGGVRLRRYSGLAGNQKVASSIPRLLLAEGRSSRLPMSCLSPCTADPAVGVCV